MQDSTLRYAPAITLAYPLGMRLTPPAARGSTPFLALGFGHLAPLRGARKPTSYTPPVGVIPRSILRL